MEKKYKIAVARKTIRKTDMVYRQEIQRLKTPGRYLLPLRVEIIERVFARLNTEDRKVSDLIFIKHYSQAKGRNRGDRQNDLLQRTK